MDGTSILEKAILCKQEITRYHYLALDHDLQII